MKNLSIGLMLLLLVTALQPTEVRNGNTPLKGSWNFTSSIISVNKAHSSGVKEPPRPT